MVSILIDNEILLRSYQTDDAAALFVAVDKWRAHLRPWLSWVDSTTKQEHSLQFIQHSVMQSHNQEALSLGIFHNREIIGGIGMHQWDHNLKKAQIGYWIGKEHEGKGILSKCLARFLNFLFDKINLNKVEIWFMAKNQKSAAVAERFGFKTEGYIRQSYLRNGMLEDLIVTGLLKSEWNEIRDKFQ